MPGQYYIYIPFSEEENNSELLKAANGWEYNMRQIHASRAYINGAPFSSRKIPKIHNTGTTKPLSVLTKLDPDEYTLYVFGHSNAGVNKIFNIQGTQNPDRVELSAGQLATRLIGDGMPSNIKNLKIYACRGAQPGLAKRESGQLTTVYPPQELEKEEGEYYTAFKENKDNHLIQIKHPFAFLVYQALVTRGIEKVNVSGYWSPLIAETVGTGHMHKRTGTGSRPGQFRTTWPK